MRGTVIHLVQQIIIHLARWKLPTTNFLLSFLFNQNRGFFPSQSVNLSFAHQPPFRKKKKEKKKKEVKMNFKCTFGYNLFCWKLKTENTIVKQFLNVWIVLWDLILKFFLLNKVLAGPVNSAWTVYFVP